MLDSPVRPAPVKRGAVRRRRRVSKFELRRLRTYDDESLLAEIRRVCALIPGPTVSVSEFDQLSKVESSTLRRRFGSWRAALAAAGVEQRFDESNRRRTKSEVIAELKRVAQLVGSSKLTRAQFQAQSNFGYGAVVSAFGSWSAALEAADLAVIFIRQPSDEQFFENLLSVWSHHARAPFFREMKQPPSRITAKAYARRWGSWTNALHEFVETMEMTDPPATPQSDELARPPSLAVPPQGPREIPLRLRYRVLVRDHFRCVICGASPAVTLGCSLHVDHVVAYAHGGATVFENLRTLCGPCNIGKGVLAEPAV